ncbi:MAG: energy transducer TonB [Burkholderiaceae bacterium]|nr:MAG: energy transducer TonB [Burkholderiaceae bacterium]
MSFVQPRGDGGRRQLAIGVAVVFHLVLAWALMNGLGRAVLQVVNAPIETHLVEEVKPPPPPPKVIEMPPPPKIAPPPPAFVPPPEVQVQAPPPAQPTITATVPIAPAEPPPAVARVEAPPAPPKPAAPERVSAAVVCSNYGKVMGDAAFPRDAQRAGLDEGSALIQFTLGPAGEVRDIKAIQASHPSFAKGAMRIVAEYRCTGQGHDVTVQVPFAFKSN